jgi:hypothetical protein
MDELYQQAHNSAMARWKGKIEEARNRGDSREQMLEAFKKDGKIFKDIRYNFISTTESAKDRIAKEIMDKIYQDIKDNFGAGGGEKKPLAWNENEIAQSVKFYTAFIETEVFAWGEHAKRVFRANFINNIKATIYSTGADRFQLTAWFVDHEAGYVKDMDSYISDMDNMYQGALDDAVGTWKAKIESSLKQGFSSAQMNEAFKDKGVIYWDLRNKFVYFTEA